MYRVRDHPGGCADANCCLPAGTVANPPVEGKALTTDEGAASPSNPTRGGQPPGGSGPFPTMLKSSRFVRDARCGAEASLSSNPRTLLSSSEGKNGSITIMLTH